MAFPTLNISGLTDAVARTSYTVPYNGTASAGDLLFVVFSGQGGAHTHTTPAGYTLLQSQAWNVAGGAADGRASLYAKFAAGGETNVTIACSIELDEGLGVSYRVPVGTWYGTSVALGVASAASGQATNTDPPNLAPGWGALDIAWIAATSGVSAGSSGSLGPPTNYGNFQSRLDGSFRLGAAHRELNASSENPGAFAGYDASSGGHVNFTVAIRPAEEAASGDGGTRGLSRIERGVVAINGMGGALH